MMVYLISFSPKYCPNCGLVLQVDRFDFQGSTSMSCTCGARFCYAPKEKLVRLADELGSDLPMYEEHGS